MGRTTVHRATPPVTGAAPLRKNTPADGLSMPWKRGLCKGCGVRAQQRPARLPVQTIRPNGCVLPDMADGTMERACCFAGFCVRKRSTVHATGDETSASTCKNRSSRTAPQSVRKLSG